MKKGMWFAIALMAGCGGGGGGGGGEKAGGPISLKWGEWRALSEYATSARSPDLIAGPDGYMLAVWTEDADLSQLSSGNDWLKVSRYVPGIGWSVPRQISQDCANNTRPTVKLDASSRPWIGYGGDGDHVRLIRLGALNADNWDSSESVLNEVYAGWFHLEHSIRLFLNSDSTKVFLIFRKGQDLRVLTVNMRESGATTRLLAQDVVRYGTAFVNDKLHVLWSKTEGVFYYDHDEGLGGRPVSTGTTGLPIAELVVDVQNKIHLVMRTNTSVLIGSLQGTFSDGFTLTNAREWTFDEGTVRRDFGVSSHPNDPVLLILATEIPEDSSSVNPPNSTLYCRRFDRSTGDWLDSAKVEIHKRNDGGGILSMAHSYYGQGNRILLWSENQRPGDPESPYAIRSIRYIPGSGWSAVETVAETGNGSIGRITLQIDDSGSGAAVWDQRAAFEDIETLWAQKRRVFVNRLE